MIEDVLQLRHDAVRQSVFIIVDSRTRDHAAYPTPSEYTITFDEPFRNVVGFEVVDATIPRTQYVVDDANSTITFAILPSASTTPAASNYTTVQVPLGDYTIQTLMPALQSVLQMHVGNDPAQPVATIDVEAISSPPELRSILRFRCPYPFAFDMSQSTIAETLGFDLFVPAAEAAVPVATRRFQPTIPYQSQIYHSVDQTGLADASTSYFAFQGPTSVLRHIPLSGGNTAAQRFTVATDTFLYQVYAAASAADPAALTAGTAAGGYLSWAIVAGTMAAPGTSPPVASGAIPISYIDGTPSESGPIQPSAPVRLFASNVYWLALSAPAAADPFGLGVYYNDVVPSPATSGSLLVGGATSLDTPQITYQASVQVQVQDEYHELVAPGMYNLIGEPYVLLRVPEIESVAQGSLAYTANTLGLARFKLGGIGFNENRVDFKQTGQREFHPIGRLARITIRFETQAGALYNFRGINHNIMFAVHFYEPKPALTAETWKPLLNPNYEIDFTRYRYTQEAQEPDSDDETHDYSEIPLENYRPNEGRYRPGEVRARGLEDLLALRKIDDLEIRRELARAEAEVDAWLANPKK